MATRKQNKRAKALAREQASRRARFKGYLAFLETRVDRREDGGVGVGRDWALQGVRIGVEGIALAPVRDSGVFDHTLPSYAPLWFVFVVEGVMCWGSSIEDWELRTLCSSHKALMAATRFDGARGFRAVWDELVREDGGG